VTVFRVDSQNQFTGITSASRFEPVRILQGARADDNSGDAPPQGLGNMRFGAKSPAKLARDTDRAKDAPYAFTLDRVAFPGAVEVNDVQVSRTLTDPAPGHAGRIITEDRLLIVIPLPEADTFSAPQVDGRKDKHGPSLRSPTEELANASAVSAPRKKKVYRKAANL
jgi:hypothetical protein